MQDRPTAAELLAAVAQYLAEDLLPAVPAEHRFGVRVAANACAVSAREAAAGPEAEHAEAERMRALLALAGRDAPPRAHPRELQRAAALAIREGALDAQLLAARDLLRDSVRAKLAIAHPGYHEFADDGRA